ncbi:MAG: C_GCAxxG_C_C family protein [Desulfarculus sp.]|nr:C_GCAxxG_C_C family protein [Desulfarculus sp.]
MDRVEKVMELFGQGCNCSQAMLAGFGAAYGLEQGLAQDLGRALGGGLGRSALTCGAITGAVLVLGLACQGQAGNELALRQRSYGAVRELMRRFKELHGSLECRELLGVDISSDEGLRQAKEAGLFGTRCADLVRDTARLLGALL